MPRSSRTSRSQTAQQRGGTLLGLIIGLVLGLAIALASAVYMNRASLPFMNRYQQRPNTAASEAANWKPNAGLSGTAAPPAAVTGAGQAGKVASAPLSAHAIESLGVPAGGVLGAQGATAGGTAPQAAPAAAPAASAAATPGVQYIVQIGAYSHRGDAEAQRAKVALTGLEAHLDERNVGGRTLWRVRVGPFPTAQQADAAQKTLNDSGIGSAVVRVGP
ncbi:MAG: SPOR domain-containing protein [Betaproteobacteria bacterium]|nr:SPOR domain-containing protein [Betaproteobacteria bacterium]MBU6512431.1 SPOR domain-containing protein [Betaproteobacteria bacterium]MDE1956471.1 SPOR domain-containing protein [Betaproteobacteria bacterium]MDE2152645.1 SPOR domain-containing protein [Betaproteobacteria bacterium]MDE2480315.1 SPOR domain-containing protein [Betaproteobacteria bacterium]